MLSPQLLELLRDLVPDRAASHLSVPGRDKIGPMTTRQLNRICRNMAAELGRACQKWVAPHTLRHSFATHLLEQNIAMCGLSGVARNNDKLPANSRWRLGFITLFIRVAARQY